MSTSSTRTTPRIYVASLSDYNAGRLHGKWIDADQDLDSIWKEVQTMLAASPEFRAFPQGGPAEEWAIHDYEGFGPWSLSEWESFKHVALVAEGISEHGEAFAAWVSNDDSVLRDTDYSSLEESFRESYGGCWDSEKDYAENFIEDVGLPGIGMSKLTMETYMGRKEIDILDELSSYLDWDALTRWAMEDTWTWQDSEYNVHVFRSV